LLLVVVVMVMPTLERMPWQALCMVARDGRLPSLPSHCIDHHLLMRTNEANLKGMFHAIRRVGGLRGVD
jgi:hypothetical protein